MLLDGQTDGDNSDSADLAPLRDAAGDVDTKAEPADAAIPPAPEPNKPVALATPKSRRAQAEESRQAEIKALSDSVKEMRDGLTQRDRQIGELTGHLSALAQQRQAPQPQYQAPPPQLPDPDALMEQANARLDARDMTGYHRLLQAANTAATMRAIAPVLQRAAQFQQQPAPQQQVPAELMAYFAAYPDVATHPKRDILLRAKNDELDARDFPAGPGRVRAVFEEVQATIKAMGGQNRQAPGFDRGSAAALSGVPTARSSSGGNTGKGEPRVELTPEERKYWKAGGFKDEGELAQYIAQARPERIIR